ncbi:HAD family hydrolase [Actinopolymorpha pittospori]|uniref:Phosphoglycolate phosphatase n=1 Tax=Actinopolymorpha pittospori TaxID=648752 RepID=A0A927MXI6_9ACTN|nr:HAD hydrolase-like protein [Actinopolymorpha pittospori]MBE1605035.1 phosphoglycolate phosphatase [Actinopolymorpha pittospori]
MTPVPSESLESVLDRTWPVLMDFDGPVCPIFSGGRNAVVAERMRETLRSAGVEVPDDVAATSDPIDVLRFTAGLRRGELTHHVEDTFVAGETGAAREGTPTPGAHDAIRACDQAGRPVVVVSNNSVQAIRTYLELHHLNDLIHAVIGRVPARPDLLKPHPEPVRRALRVLGDGRQSPVLVGDSTTDMEVAQVAGLASIGYAKAPERVPGLVRAGADAVTEDMAEIARVVRAGRSA